MNTGAYKFLLVTLLSLFSLTVRAHDDTSPRIFYSYESNGSDYISGIGIGVTLRDSKSNFGFELNTSLNNAEVYATDGYLEDYVAWEGSVKMGYFSDVLLYVEVGFDLTEALFHDLRYDHDDYYNSEYHDDVDGFVGVGAGIQADIFRIEAFTRLREIDSKYWEAESEVFGGFQISINF